MTHQWSHSRGRHGRVRRSPERGWSLVLTVFLEKHGKRSIFFVIEGMHSGYYVATSVHNCTATQKLLTMRTQHWCFTSKNFYLAIKRSSFGQSVKMAIWHRSSLFRNLSGNLKLHLRKTPFCGNKIVANFSRIRIFLIFPTASTGSSHRNFTRHFLCKQLGLQQLSALILQFSDCYHFLQAHQWKTKVLALCENNTSGSCL